MSASTFSTWLIAAGVVCLSFLLFLAGVLRSGPVYAGAFDATVELSAPLGSTERTFDGTNTNRGTDKLIVYTPGHSRRTTGTNQWGTEAVVSDGRVQSIGGNNQPIPLDGFVLSGHGAAQKWLLDNVVVGAKVELSGRRLIVTVDLDTYVFAARRAVRTAKDAVSNGRYLAADFDFAAAVQALADAEMHLAAAERAAGAGERGEDADAAIEATRESIRFASTAVLRAVPSFPVEVRGVWHRPVEYSADEIKSTLDGLQAAGLNAVFLETFYGGYTIYPSKIAGQRPEFEGWDPLDVWVTEAHKRGIELHLWVHVFHVGSGGLGPILSAHPEWIAVQRDGSRVSTLEPGLHYADPANPAVTDFLAALFGEMQENYAADGLHLDYIRYATTNALENTSGYSEYARKAFQAEAGVDPMEITPAKNPAAWNKWVRWQEENVTRFVRRIREQTRKQEPDMLLSAAVFGELAEARSAKRQNWPEWGKAGLIDFFTPMLYTTDAQWVGSKAASLLNQAGTALLIPGIAPFMGLTPQQTVEQIQEARQAGSPGVVMFALHSVHAQHSAAFQEGAFRRTAVTPFHGARSAATLAAWLKDRLSAFVAAGVISEEIGSRLEAALGEIAMSRGDEAALSTVETALAQLNVPSVRGRAELLRKQLSLLLKILGR